MHCICRRGAPERRIARRATQPSSATTARQRPHIHTLQHEDRASSTRTVVTRYKRIGRPVNSRDNAQ